MTFNQSEVLALVQRYNSTDKQIIKERLRDIKQRYSFQNVQIMKDLGFGREKTNQWFNRASRNIPTFEDLLVMAEYYGFSVTEVIG